jgi:hypothetical protein
LKVPHHGHEVHLCKIWADTYDIDVIKDKVRNPNFICRVCGRVAAIEKNICDPAPL